MRVVDFESIVVSTTPVGLTTSKIYPGGNDPARTVAVVQVLDAPVNVLETGSDPTGADGGGVRAEPGTMFIVRSLPNMQAFRAIRTDDAVGDARLNVQYLV